MEAKTNCLCNNNAELLDHHRDLGPMSLITILFRIVTQDSQKQILDPKDRKFQGHSLYNITTMDLLSFPKMLYRT